jgi:adenosylhomocysteine nucleosidase
MVVLGSQILQIAPFMKILITYALEAERGRLEIPGHELFFCRTGVGKVSAALTTYEAALRKRPDFVLGIGTAGTIRHQVGDILLCTRFIDRDLEQIAELGVPYELDFSKEVGNFTINGDVSGCISSGDTFQSAPSDAATADEADVYDMEAYGSAQSCKMLRLPFLSVKCVTDIIGQNSLGHWEENLQQAKEKLEKFLRALEIT